MELKPCPFCGSRCIDVSASLAFKDYSVSCDTCGAEAGFSYTREGAINRWNTRPPEPEPEAPAGIPASVLRGEDDNEGN